MKFVSQLFLSQLALLIPFMAFSQERVPPSITPDFSHQYSYYNDDLFHFIDTSHNSLNLYHRGNNTLSDLFEKIPLGNMGSALNPLTITGNKSIWSYYDFKAYDDHFRRLETMRFYDVRSPLTEATYWQGYDRGQVFNIYHTQNINPHWNASLDYKRLNALGFYTHNRNKQSSFLLNTHYNNPAKGYEAYAYFLSEKLEIEEFGGIQSDSLFESNSLQDRVLYPVNLSSDFRIMRNREVFIDQKFHLSKLFRSKPDSTKAEDRPESINFLAVGHSFKFSRRSDVYLGFPVDSFYANYFLTNNDYTDSSGYYGYENTFYVQGKIGQESKLDIRAGARNLITEYSGPNFQFNTNSWGLTSQVQGRVKELFDVKGSLDYILTGPLSESLDARAAAEMKIWKDIKAFGSYQYQLRFPDFFDQFYYSNNFIWQNNFKDQTTGILEYGLAWGNGNSIKATNYSATNYTFYNAEALPQQSAEVVKVLKLELNQNFSFWNEFIHFDNRVLYQTVSGNRDALQLPEWVSRNALYFRFKMFKVLKTLAGAEVSYFSAFDSPSFMPATARFFNARERSIGDYPLLDVFVSVKIRKARVSLRYQHVNEGFGAYNFYAAPHYPMPDRIFRIGISWRFFN